MESFLNECVTNDVGQNTEPKRGRPPGRRPLAEGNSEDTRRAIRQHSVRLFMEKGYAAVSVDDISEATGLTRATLYYHYKSKSDIFVASVLATVQAVEKMVQAIVEQKAMSVQERIRCLFELRREYEEKGNAAVDFGAGFEVSETMIHEAMQHLTPKQQIWVDEAFESLHSFTRTLMMEGIENGELRSLPPDVLDFVFWQLFKPEKYPAHLSMSRKEWEDYLQDILLFGMAKR